MDEKTQATHERILNAATEVFASKGYHDTRVDEIVDVSQTSKGSIYFHFPSKEDIFMALVDRFAALLEKRLQRVLETESGGVRRVQASLRVCVETFESHRALAKIFLIQAVGLGEAFEKKREQINEKFALIIQEQIDQAIAQGEIPALHSETAAHVWIGALYDVMIHHVQTGRPEPEQMLITLQSMLLRSIGVPEERIGRLGKEG